MGRTRASDSGGDTMKIKYKYPALYLGLNQIPTKDLKRGLKRIESHPEDIIYDGRITVNEKEGKGNDLKVGY